MKDPDQYSVSETQRRMEAALKRSLSTPPKPRKAKTKTPPSGKGGAGKSKSGA